MDADSVVMEAQFRLVAHGKFGDQPACRWIPTRELDAGCLPDPTASSIASNEILGPQRLTVRQRHIDSISVLGKPCHFTSAEDRYRELCDPACQDALNMVLPKPEHGVVPGRKIAEVQARVDIVK